MADTRWIGLVGECEGTFLATTNFEMVRKASLFQLNDLCDNIFLLHSRLVATLHILKLFLQLFNL